jgi:hypothetical protein
MRLYLSIRGMFNLVKAIKGLYMKISIKLFFIVLFFKIFSTDNVKITSIDKLINQLNLTPNDIIQRGKDEISSFVSSGVWKGGYNEGQPMSKNDDSSSYNVFMNYKGEMVNPLYIIYEECIKSFINSKINVLEIGPGHGAWSKCILSLNPKHLYCVDALSAEHNNFWQNIGQNKNVSYFQVNDFSLNEINDDSIDFVFSFGTFCHISPILCYEYFKNIYKKLHSGAQGFIMYSDYDKYSKFAIKHNIPHGYGWDIMFELECLSHQQRTRNYDVMWYFLSIERAKEILIKLGYEIINIDININERDPIVHFRKP